MHLMYYTDSGGTRIYTLKVSLMTIDGRVLPQQTVDVGSMG